MRGISLFLLLSTACLAQSRWVQTHSGPFEVITDAAPRAAKETLAQFEQFRYALGQITGRPDLQLDPPLRIVLFKNTTQRAELSRGRDRYNIAMTAGAALPAGILHDTARLLLTANIERLPSNFEEGMEEFFSTISSHGARVTWGTPPPAEYRNLNWARVHLLVTSPEYYGKLRVLLFNLQKGIDPDAAYRNSIGKSAADFEADVARYFAAGSFASTDAPSRPLNPERDFTTPTLIASAATLARADLLNGESKALYETMLRDHVNVAESYEGLALLALRDKDADAARKNLQLAVDAGSKNAAILIEYAKLDPDPLKSQSWLEKAVQSDPKSAEAHFLLAQKLKDPAKQIAEWNLAAKLAPQNAAYHAALAQAYLDRKQFAEAAKSWRGAEQAAANPEDREKYRQAWMSIEQQRLDFEESERQRIAMEKARDIERLKNAARAQLHAAEAKANGAPLSPEDAARAVPWWDGPKPSGHVAGSLKQVECLGKQLRFVLQTDAGKPVKLLARDPANIVVVGAEARTFSCGPQNAGHVIVEYFPKANARLGVAGELASIEFR